MKKANAIAHKTGGANLLNRILESPGLVDAVRTLRPEVLGRLIDRIGLEDSAEIVSLATTEQLSGIFDGDLWKSKRPGLDETFNIRRFALWLEVMLEAGGDFAADKLCELPDELLMLGLGSLILVINIDELGLQQCDEDEDGWMLDKALDACLCHEFDDLMVISKDHSSWDTTLGILLALEKNHFDNLYRVLERIRRASAGYIDSSGGLYNVLTADEMLESDASADREDRRAREGFIAPSSAAAFLRLARESDLSVIVRSTTPDPVTKAYFRDLGPTVLATPAGRQKDINRSKSDLKLLNLLKEAEVVKATPRTRLLSGKGKTDKTDTAYKTYLTSLGTSDPESYEIRMEELAYLANVLMAGSSTKGRRYRQIEALEKAVEVCNTGLEYLLAGKDRKPEQSYDSSAVKLFMIGWKLSKNL